MRARPDVEAIRRAFTPIPVLASERLRMRELRADDAEAIFHYASDPEVTRYVAFDTHPSIEVTHAWLEGAIASGRRSEHLTWAITLRDSAALIGTIGFPRWALEHGRAELGYVFAKERWNQGYATEAARAVIRFAFDVMKLNRVEAMCENEHKPSARVLEKVGMQFEGLHRREQWVKGDYRDMRHYAILRSEG